MQNLKITLAKCDHDLRNQPHTIRADIYQTILLKLACTQDTQVEDTFLIATFRRLNFCRRSYAPLKIPVVNEADEVFRDKMELEEAFRT